MGINKNFVVKHGLEVSTDLVFANADTNKIGIGTTNPTSELELYFPPKAKFSVKSTEGESLIEVESGITSTSGIDFKQNGSLKGNISFNSYTLDVLEINSSSDKSVVLATGGGKVGIATTNPSAELTVSGDLFVSNDVLVSGVSTFAGITTVTGNTLFSKQLNISGLSTFNADVTLIQDLSVNGNLTLTGISTFVGFSTFNNDVYAAGVITATTYNGQVNSGIATITNIIGTAATITTLRSTTGNFTTGYIVTGVTTNFTSTNGAITNLTGTAATITTLRGTTGNFDTGYIVTGVTTNFTSTNGTITNLTGTASTFTNSTITNLTGTASTFTNSTITNLTGTAGTITTFNSTNGTITNLTGTAGTITTIRSTTGNFDTGYIVTGVTTNFTSTNGTITNLTGTAGTITTLRSTTGNFDTSYAVTGVATNFSSTNGTITNLTGTAGTITTLRSTTGNFTTGYIVTGVTTNFTSTNGTITNLTGTAGTITTFNSTNGTITNLTGTAGTITTFNSTNGTITNGTITNLTGTAGTITTFNSTNGTVTNLNSQQLVISGVSTFSGGIQGIGIQSGSVNITTGIITALNFVGAGNSLSYNAGTKTVDINIGGGQWTYQDTSNTATSSIYRVNGNVGLGTINPIAKLDVRGDARVSGVVTATLFVGDGSGLTGITASGTGIQIRDDGSLAGVATVVDFGSNLSVSFASGIATITGTGVSISDNTSTDATTYLAFTSATSGSVTSVNVSSTKLQFNPSTGNLSATQFTSLSDATQKTNIRPIENPIEITKQLEGVRFEWIDNNKPSLGLIAQEVEKVLPELVETNSDGIKSVSYSNMVGLLIEAIKEQQVRIEELERKLNA